MSGLNDAVVHHAPYAVIAAETGGVLEFALSSWPCFLFSSGSAPCMSPLAWDCPHVRTVTREPHSMSNLVSFVKSRELPVYCEQLRICAKRHVQFYGEEADDLLAALLGEALDLKSGFQ